MHDASLRAQIDDPDCMVMPGEKNVSFMNRSICQETDGTQEMRKETAGPDHTTIVNLQKASVACIISRRWHHCLHHSIMRRDQEERKRQRAEPRSWQFIRFQIFSNESWRGKRGDLKMWSNYNVKPAMLTGSLFPESRDLS